MEIPLFGSSGKWEKINKNFVAIGIDKRGNLDYIYTVRVYTIWTHQAIETGEDNV